MLEVDWASLFKSFYEQVKIKIACRDPSKILAKRLFELDRKLYMISIAVEGYELEAGKDEEDGGMIMTQGMKLEMTVMRSMMACMTMIRWILRMARIRVLPFLLSHP
jgi:hypothetical protein